METMPTIVKLRQVPPKPYAKRLAVHGRVLGMNQLLHQVAPFAEPEIGEEIINLK